MEQSPRGAKLHAVTDAKGRPIKFFMSASLVRDYTGAAPLLSSLPEAEWLDFYLPIGEGTLDLGFAIRNP